MEKSKCAVIQDDILAVKHALANGISFEALEGDDLKELLATLQVQRAEVIADAKRNTAATSAAAGGAGGGGGGGGGASAKPTPPKATPRRSAPKASSNGAQSARIEAPAAKDKPAKDKPAGGASRRKQASSPAKRPAASPARAQAPHAQEEVAKKPRTMSTAERLRQLRKSITVGNVVSVLMDIPMTGAWIRCWVRGEVTREVSSSPAQS